VVTLGPVGGGRAEPAMFRAAGPVETGPLPQAAEPAPTPDWIVRPDRVRGVFRWDNRIIIVLDIGKLVDRRCW